MQNILHIETSIGLVFYMQNTQTSIVLVFDIVYSKIHKTNIVLVFDMQNTQTSTGLVYGYTQ